jgi:branched-chain amino acid aminotransferase
MNYIFINGNYYTEEEAKISVMDHAVLYGDGVYDTFRIYNGKAFEMQKHLERLYNSANLMEIIPPMRIDELRDMIKSNYHWINWISLIDAFVRIVFTRGVGKMGVDMRTCNKPTSIIIFTEREESNVPIKAIISSIRRISKNCIPSEIKSLNYVNSVLAKIEAIKAGADDAIMVNEYGEITEATTENVFIVKGGKIYTPPLKCGLLAGITRNVIMSNFQVFEKELSRNDCLEADEIFLSGTGNTITPVVKLNDKIIGDGLIGTTTHEVLKKLVELRQFGEEL